jgi:hypothetical protein
VWIHEEPLGPPARAILLFLGNVPLSLVVFFALMSTLSDINTATLGLKKITYLFTLNPPISLN